MRILFTFLAALLLSISSLAQTDACIDCSIIDPDAICFLIFDPVCGCNGETYSNDCVAQTQAGVTSWTSGECPNNNVSECSDLNGIDFGECDLFLGYGVIAGQCVGISGCSTIGSNEVDYADALFQTADSCQLSCLCGLVDGLTEVEGLDVLIGSSPIRDEFQIYYNTSERLDMEILDITGRTVLQRTVRSAQNVAVSELGNGLYIMLLKKGSDVVHSDRLIIKR